MLVWLKYHLVERVNWLRTKARYQRWDEEVELVKSEMTWTLLWFGFQRNKWDERLGRALMAQSLGHQCYAQKQISLWKKFIAYAQEEF
jgi:hypothetical protein